MSAINDLAPMEFEQQGALVKAAGCDRGDKAVSAGK
jgi:hypothetical protein